MRDEGRRGGEREAGRCRADPEGGGRYLTKWELKMQARTEKLLLTWGRYESIRRFMRRISKVSCPTEHVVWHQNFSFPREDFAGFLQYCG